MNALRVRDEQSLTRDNQVENYKIATFWLGKHGPFTERILASEFTAAALNERVEKLQRELTQLEG
jgi:hypothetical protein